MVAVHADEMLADEPTSPAPRRPRRRARRGRAARADAAPRRPRPPAAGRRERSRPRRRAATGAAQERAGAASRRALAAAGASPRTRAAAERAADAAARRSATSRAFTDPRAQRRAADRPLAVRAAAGAARDALRARGRRRPRAAAVGAHLSRRLLDRHVRGDAVRRPSSPTPSATGRASGAPAASRRTSARPGAAWSPRTARAGRATSSTPTSRSTSPTGRPRPTPTDEILVIADAGAARRRPRPPRSRAYWEAVWLADGDAAARAGRARRAGGRGRRGARGRARRRLRAVQPGRRSGAAATQDRRRAVASRSWSSRPTRRPRPASWTQAPQVDAVPRALRRARLPRRRRKTLEAIGGAGRAAALRRARSLGRSDADPTGDPSRRRRPVRARRAEVDGRLPTRRGGGHGARDRPHAPSRRGGLRPAAGARACSWARDERRRPGGAGGAAPPPRTRPQRPGARAAGHADAQHDRRRRPATRGSTTPTRASTTASNAPLFTPTADPMLKRDGQWLAERAGRRPGAVRRRPRRAAAADQMQARAMQRALWPATHRLLDGQAAGAGVQRRHGRRDARVLHATTSAAAARCRRCASARQPYGILPTTAFSRIGWLDPRSRRARRGDPQLAFLRGLLAVLRGRRRLDGDERRRMPTSASRATRTRLLLDIVGLHPSSVEYLLALRREPERAVQHRQPVGLRARTSCRRCQQLGAASRGGRPARPARLHRRRRSPTFSSTTSSASASRITTVDRRPAAVGDRPDPRLHRRRPQLHPVADRRRRARRWTRCAPSTASPATSRRRRCSTSICGTR